MVCHRKNSGMLIQNSFMLLQYHAVHIQNVEKIPIYTVVF